MADLGRRTVVMLVSLYLLAQGAALVLVARLWV